VGIALGYLNYATGDESFFHEPTSLPG